MTKEKSICEDSLPLPDLNKAFDILEGFYWILRFCRKEIMDRANFKISSGALVRQVSFTTWTEKSPQESEAGFKDRKWQT